MQDSYEQELSGTRAEIGRVHGALTPSAIVSPMPVEAAKPAVGVLVSGNYSAGRFSDSKMAGLGDPVAL